MSKYFNLSQAWEDLKGSSGAGNVAIATAKFIGKGVSNAAVFGATRFLSNSVENANKNSAKMLKRDDLTEEQRKKYTEIYEKSSEYLDRRKNK